MKQTLKLSFEMTDVLSRDRTQRIEDQPRYTRQDSKRILR